MGEFLIAKDEFVNAKCGFAIAKDEFCIAKCEFEVYVEILHCMCS